LTWRVILNRSAPLLFAVYGLSSSLLAARAMSDRQPKLSEVVMFKASMITMMCCAALLILSGCTSDTGIVRLYTEPSGAKYYIDGIEKGVTPAEFEWEMEQPILLEIKKDGYHSEKELLDKAWLKYQFNRGNIGKIQVGKATSQLTLTINRKLKAAPQ